MLTIRTTPYKMDSESCRNLTDQLSALLPDADVGRAGPNGTIVPQIVNNGFNSVICNAANPKAFINWGYSHIAKSVRPTNKPGFLSFNTVSTFDDYSNKKKFFNRFNPLSESAWMPRWWETAQQVEASMPGYSTVTDRPVIVERHSLTGHSGEGIRLLNFNDKPDPTAKMWTRYIPKSREFRVHFFKDWAHPNNYIFKITEKLLRKAAVDNPVPGMYQVRNWQNGWIFASHLQQQVPSAVTQVAKKYVSSSLNTLDFGALDIIYNKRSNTAYVLEVNTAPGIEGSTVDWYAKIFKMILDTHQWASVHTKPMCPDLMMLTANLDYYELASVAPPGAPAVLGNPNDFL